MIKEPGATNGKPTHGIVNRRTCLRQLATANMIAASIEGLGFSRGFRPPFSISDQVAAQTRDLVRQLIIEGQTSGAVVCIGSTDRIEFHEAFGFRQIEPAPSPMTVETIFDLASLTKPLATGLSLMKLVESKEVELDSPAQRYLPSFRGNQKEEITLQQLLIHTSGLIPDNALSDYQQGQAHAWERIDALELQGAPGTAFRYSDVGFIVLGRVIEAVSGMPLDRFAAQQLYNPLHLNQTLFAPPASLARLAVTTERRGDNWIRGEVHDPRAHALHGVAGHAGLFSTSMDLARLSQTLLRTLIHDEMSVLSRASLQTMTADHLTPEGHRRGLGWDKRSSYSSNRGNSMSDAAFGHGGFTGTSLWIDPDLDCFVIFLGNRLHPDGEGNVNRGIGTIGGWIADARRTQR